jgi:putative flippase GtrA
MSGIYNWLEEHPRAEGVVGWVGRLPIIGGLWLRLIARPKEIERLAKFATVGLIGSVVDFTVLNIMKWLFVATGLGEGWSTGFSAHQIQLVAANAVSFSAAVLSNFTWNRLWTFPESRERPLGRQLLQFTIVNVLGYAINTVLLLVLDTYVFQLFVGERLSFNLAKAVAIGVVLLWNFGMNRIWTYGGIE